MATPATAVAVVAPVSVAPAVPVPATIAAVTTVELSAVSVAPFARTWITGCVANAPAGTPPERLRADKQGSLHGRWRGWRCGSAAASTTASH